MQRPRTSEAIRRMRPICAAAAAATPHQRQALALDCIEGPASGTLGLQGSLRTHTHTPNLTLHLVRKGGAVP